MQILNRSKPRWAPVLVAVIGLAFVFTTARSQAAKPIPNPRAAVTFVDGHLDPDGVGMDFVSDGNGPYVDGPDGSGRKSANIVAQFWVGGSKDLTLNLYNSFPYRSFITNYKFFGCPLNGAQCLQIDSSTSFGDGSARGWFLNINSIASMQPGERRWTTASFASSILGLQPSSNTPLWQFDWCDDGAEYDPSPFGATVFVYSGCTNPNGLNIKDDGSQMVSVTRSPNSPNGLPNYTWIVSTDPLTGTPLGNISELVERGNNYTKKHGLYRTRFQLSIACISGSACDILPH